MGNLGSCSMEHKDADAGPGDWLGEFEPFGPSCDW